MTHPSWYRPERRAELLAKYYAGTLTLAEAKEFGRYTAEDARRAQQLDLDPQTVGAFVLLAAAVLALIWLLTKAEK